jgi:membrane-bound lytic murein transglycosylase D
MAGYDHSLMGKKVFLLSRKLPFVVLMALLIGACTSEETTDSQISLPVTQAHSDTIIALPSITPITPVLEDTIIADEVVPSDSLVATMLETARLHYMSAISAASSGDSIRSVVQFEEAIGILDELSTVPGIDENRDFNDLSRAVVEDYELHIAKIDSLSPESSIFALREKLNQVTETVDSIVTPPTLEIHAGTTVPLVMNAQVEQTIAFFQGRGKRYMERWLQTAGKYFPLMRKILREEAVPEELVYLTMVESGVNPIARSWARAVGMWQFMKGTGKLYGLDVGYWFDERRDFEKATRAAARHLRDLHDEFGDWYLVLAAYNSGAGRVYSAIRRTGSTDFWELRRRLPRQTRNYVPQYIGVTLMAMNPERYGINGVVPDTPVEYEFVEVDDAIDLGSLAECAGTDVETLRDLNPELVRWCTPPGVKGYRLRVPANSSSQFRVKYAALPVEKKRDWIVHTVKRGESLAKIAARYDVAPGALQDVNRLSPGRLKPGTQIVIPVPKGSTRFASLIAASARMTLSDEQSKSTKTRSNNRSKLQRALAASHGRSDELQGRISITYVVKKGDTFGHIAAWFHCRAADIRNWNDIPYGRRIRVGQSLDIWVPEQSASRYDGIAKMSSAEKNRVFASHASTTGGDDTGAESSSTYVVKKGDTLEEIAKAHGVSVAQIMRWNKLRRSSIRGGQRLTILSGAKNVRLVAESKSAKSKAGKKGEIVYVVKKGDTLWDIARAHEVTTADLRAWNDLGKNKIVAGQELVIRRSNGMKQNQ